MEIVINLNKLKDLSINKYLTLIKIYNQLQGIEINYQVNQLDYLSLRDDGYISISGDSVSLNQKAIDLLTVKGRNYVQLADQIRQLFPKGSKSGRYPWRGTLKTIIDKLKKLDKQDLSDYTDESIIQAVTNYVNSFTSKDMDLGMQIAPYFIEKDGISSLLSWLENNDYKELKMETTGRKL